MELPSLEDDLDREIRAHAARPVAEGCLTVDMEAAGFFAVARYRGVRLAQRLYAGDFLAGENGDDRGWTGVTDIPERLFRLAADACLALVDLGERPSARAGATAAD